MTLLLVVLIRSTLSSQAPAIGGAADHELEVAANVRLALMDPGLASNRHFPPFVRDKLHDLLPCPRLEKLVRLVM